MFRLFKHECKMNFKNLIIWLFCVSGMCLCCILLFSSMEESMGAMAETMASMGAFASAFGMDRLSIATLEGFYTAEVGTIHTLGGSMFAALLGIGLLSKEEEGHTGDFLHTLPISRKEVVGAKYMTLVTGVTIFNVLSVALYLVGIVILGEEIALGEFFLYHGMQWFLHLEIGTVCYLVSACNRKNKLGIGLGLTFLFYVWDLLGRVIPDLKDTLFLTPFSYANASDIFSTGEVEWKAFVVGAVVLTGAIVGAFTVYNKKDLAV